MGHLGQQMNFAVFLRMNCNCYVFSIQVCIFKVLIVYVFGGMVSFSVFSETPLSTVIVPWITKGELTSLFLSLTGSLLPSKSFSCSGKSNMSHYYVP